MQDVPEIAVRPKLHQSNVQFEKVMVLKMQPEKSQPTKLSPVHDRPASASLWWDPLLIRANCRPILFPSWKNDFDDVAIAERKLSWTWILSPSRSSRPWLRK
jgi:hypothetical protein